MDEDIVVKIREKEAYEVIKYIAIGYLVFLFFYALILDYSETIIQVTFIGVFAIIIDVLNSGELIVDEKGLKTKSLGFISFKKIYRLKLQKRTLIIYTRDSSKPYKINMARSEDYKLVEKTYRYIDAKVRRIEEEKNDNY